MAIIEAENPEIRKELEKLENLVFEGGGGVHSDLVIREAGGGLNLETREPMGAGKEIIRLSREAVLPTDKCEVTVKGENFEVTYPKASNLTTVQRKLMESMLNLYNLTNKVALHKDFSFLLSLEKYPELIERLAAGRSFGQELAKWRPEVEKGLKGEKFDEFIAQTFLKTRHLGYSDPVRYSSVSILMPIIDFLNHHWQGATFTMGQGVRQGDLCVGARQVVDGSLECYAFYNVMDSFDTLLRYDFVDSFAPIVRSIPLELDVPGRGTIKVQSHTGAVNKKKLVKEVVDLFRYMPHVTLNPEKTALVASHLLIPTEGSPLALRRILQLLLFNLTGETDQSAVRTWVRGAEERVLQENIRYYDEIIALAQKLAAEKGASPGLERISRLAALQLEKIAAYKTAIQALSAQKKTQSA